MRAGGVLTALILIVCGLGCPLTSHAETWYGKPHRYVEEDFPTSTPTLTPAPTPDSPPPAGPIQALFDAINQSRAAVGVASLAFDARESQCSVGHSAHMAEQGQLSHDQFPDDICIQHLTAGENIGKAYGDPEDAVLLLQRLMFEEGPCPDNPCSDQDFDVHGHYWNLVNPLYTRVGIGIYYGSDGETWLTEDFTG